MHTTTTPENYGRVDVCECPVTAIVPVGLPGAGCSTICSHLSDIGVPGTDITASPDEFDQTITTAIEQIPHCFWVDNVTNTEHLQYLEDRYDVDAVFPVRILVPNSEVRKRRYLEREILFQENGPVSETKLDSVRDEMENREELESPVPSYDLEIVNDVETCSTELIVRLDNVVETLTVGCKC